MPDRPHHTEKFKRCVEQVMAKGREEGSAYAICTTQFQKSGIPIFEAAEEAVDPALEALARNIALDQPLPEPRHLHLCGALGTVKTVMRDGVEHLVVPLVALVEGVIHAVNADTPERVPLATIQKAASSWNGKPVTLGHPVKNGRQCSADDPEIREAHAFGTIENSRVEGTKLLMDAVINPLRALKLAGKEFVERIRHGNPAIEVSVGAHVLTDRIEGQCGDRPYKGTWLDALGDHLAFLPNGIGACSLAMGCGTHRAAMRVLADKLELVVAEAPPTPVKLQPGDIVRNLQNDRGEKKALVVKAVSDHQSNPLLYRIVFEGSPHERWVDHTNTYSVLRGTEEFSIRAAMSSLIGFIRPAA